MIQPGISVMKDSKAKIDLKELDSLEMQIWVQELAWSATGPGRSGTGFLKNR